jgi:phosphoenolpyruvate carboxykinase (ATP)
MQNLGNPSSYSIQKHGLYNLNKVYWNLSSAELVEAAVIRKEGKLSNKGAFVVKTGKHTGRSPQDKFFVQNNHPEDREIYWGNINRPIAPAYFDKVFNRISAYLQGRDVFVHDVCAGAHPDYQMNIRIISEEAWIGLFSHNLFREICSEKQKSTVPDFTIIQTPHLQANPIEDGLNSSTFILVDFTRKIALIGNTGYGGEVKKTVFTIMNHILPRKNVVTMHCSANIGEKKDVALFFGLSGTGKTTLSSDEDRFLIGDDEHGWCDDGIFNFEGGCYAKTINLNPEFEPIIWSASNRFGTILENVILDVTTREPDFNNACLTENIRSAYPLSFVPNYEKSGRGDHPQNIFFLSADAFGVLPPISRLTKEQAMYYFLSGYTAKLAGTEVGLGKEPVATFSTCFGAPFLPLKPSIYAEMLGTRIDQHDVNVWLVNTGWSGGAYGVGERIKLPYTRAMIKAALSGEFDKIEFTKEPYFGLRIPLRCPDVSDHILNPANTWKNLKEYETQANELKARFHENFKEFEDMVSIEIQQAAPQALSMQMQF